MAPRAGRLHGASEILWEALSSRRALPEAGAQGGERNEGRAVAEFVRCRAGWSCDVGKSIGEGGQGLSVGSSTLVVEVDGRLAETEQLLSPLSRGTSVASHFENVNALMSFCWVVDGTVRLRFDPLFAFDRSGPDSDNLVEVMEQVGFDLRAGEGRSIDNVTGAAFALAGYGSTSLRRSWRGRRSCAVSPRFQHLRPTRTGRSSVRPAARDPAESCSGHPPLLRT